MRLKDLTSTGNALSWALWALDLGHVRLMAVRSENLAELVSCTHLVRLTPPPPTGEHGRALLVPRLSCAGGRALRGRGWGVGGDLRAHLEDTEILGCGSRLPAPFTSRTLVPTPLAPALGQEQNHYHRHSTCRSPGGRHHLCSRGRGVAEEFWR